MLITKIAIDNSLVAYGTNTFETIVSKLPIIKLFYGIAKITHEGFLPVEGYSFLDKGLWQLYTYTDRNIPIVVETIDVLQHCLFLKSSSMFMHDMIKTYATPMKLYSELYTDNKSCFPQLLRF